MPKNIYAYTANTSPYPEFISLNRVAPGEIVLTVREAAKPGPHSDKDCGATVEVRLPEVELRKMLSGISQELSEAS